MKSRRATGPDSPLGTVCAGAVAVLTALAVCLTPQAAQAAATNAWTAAYSDGGNTSNNPGQTGITPSTAGRVQRAWTSKARSQSPFPPAVVGSTAYRVVVGPAPRLADLFQAASVRSGAVLWQLELPHDGDYGWGLTVVGQRAVVPFGGHNDPGGVLTVDLQTHRIAWTRYLPPPTLSWVDDITAGLAYTDGVRVFVPGSGNVVNTYRLTDGKPLWTAPTTFDSQGAPNGVAGMAVANGVLYTGGDEGIVARDAATGRRLWVGPAFGIPVVAGGRVFGILDAEVAAFAAGGCGRATCVPLWRSHGATDSVFEHPVISGADASTLFVTTSGESPTGAPLGRVVRLSAATGAVQWSASIGRATLGLVRGGGMIWLFNEYVDGGGGLAGRIVGFSASATGSAPGRIINLPQDEWGFPMNLSLAGGTLFHQTWVRGYLVGYRVPGT